MPAAAVIPAPIAYINFVAVKTLVVGFLARRFSGARSRANGKFRPSFAENVWALYWV